MIKGTISAIKIVRVRKDGLRLITNRNKRISWGQISRQSTINHSYKTPNFMSRGKKEDFYVQSVDIHQRS